MTADVPTRLRATFDAAAAGPVPPAWDAIRDRVEQGAPRRRAPWLAVAAAVALLAAIGAAVVAMGPDGGDGTVRATAPPPPPAPTGWYVPQGLPAGWAVESVEANVSQGTSCASSTTRWVADARGATMTLGHVACGHELPEGPEVDLGSGVVGRTLDLADEPGGVGQQLVAWDRDGTWSLRGEQVTAAEAAAVARAIVADPDRGDLPLEGFRRFDRRSHGPGAGGGSVDVVVVAPSGRRAWYSLSRPGTGGDGPGPTAVTVPGQDLPVVALAGPAEGWSAHRYEGAWPGADLTVYRLVRPDEGSADAMSDDELLVLVGALRPATTEQWRAFLATVAQVHPAARDATTLADLGS